jgi:hypothetical protein
VGRDSHGDAVAGSVRYVLGWTLAPGTLTCTAKTSRSLEDKKGFDDPKFWIAGWGTFMSGVVLTRISVGSVYPAYAGDISANGQVVSFFTVPTTNDGTEIETLFLRSFNSGVVGAQNSIVSTSFVDIEPGLGADILKDIFGGYLSQSGRFVTYSIQDQALGIATGTGTETVYRYDSQAGDTLQVSAPPSTVEINGVEGISSNGAIVLYINELYLFDFVNPQPLTISLYAFDATTNTSTTVFQFPSDQYSNFVPRQFNLSGNGRYVSFVSRAGLVQPTDTIGNVASLTFHQYVRDLTTNSTIEIGLPTPAAALPGHVYDVGDGFLSNDGRKMAIETTDFLTNGPNADEVYVVDLVNRTYKHIVVTSDGGALTQANLVAFSGDGLHIAFESSATNLLTGPNNGRLGLYVVDVISGHVTYIADMTGAFTGTHVGFGNIAFSDDGTELVFSTAQNFPTKNGDFNNQSDVYVATFLPPNLTINVVAGDDYVNATETSSLVVVSGTSDAVGSVVVVSIGGGLNGGKHFAVVQPNGTWSTKFNFGLLADGTYTIDAIVTDSAGTSQSTSRAVVLDRVPPVLAITSVAGDGTINANEAPATVVAGFSDAIGQLVTISIDGSVVAHARVQADGSWSTTVNASSLADGTHGIQADVTDPAGNPSNVSQNFQVDQTPPTVHITSVAQDDVIGPAEATVGAPIVGTSNAIGQSVTIFVDGQFNGAALVDANGNWQTTLGPNILGGGVHQVKATVTDPSGNFAASFQNILIDQPIIRASLTATGQQQTIPYIDNYLPSISADGRLVAFFETGDGGLVPGDTNGFFDVFVKNIVTGAISLVSKSGTTQANSYSSHPKLSADGSTVVFVSEASNLVAGVGDLKTHHLFVRDLATGGIHVVDVSAGGDVGNASVINNNTYSGAISSDGRYVAFTSFASNLVSGDNNNLIDVFVKDLQTGAVTLVSSTATGSGNGSSQNASISADGHLVAFESTASNLVSSDNDGKSDIFVRDITTGSISLVAQGFMPQLSADGHFVVYLRPDGPASSHLYEMNLTTGVETLVSASANGTPGDSPDSDWRVSADGRYVVFTSGSSNLVPGDTNGRADAFVKDMVTGDIELISSGIAGNLSNGSDFTGVDITADGRYAVFTAYDGTLVAGDTNQANDIFVRVLQPYFINLDPIAGTNLLGSSGVSAATIVSGHSDLIGATVNIQLDTATVATASVLADGSWSTVINTLLLADGTDTVWGTITDPFGFQSGAGDILTIDRTGPSIQLTSDKGHLGTGETATITFKFSEAINGFDLGDVTVNGGALSSLSVLDAQTYTAIFTPQAGTHSANLSVAAGTFTDLAGNPNTNTSLTLGLAIDGYIAGATVFADANGNGQWDDGEALAITDANGAFEIQGGFGDLILSGGFDIATGLPFFGHLSSPESASVITPLTTLLVALETEGVSTPDQVLKTALGLDAAIDLADIDPIAATLAGSPDGVSTLAASAIVSDTVAMISAALGGSDPIVRAGAFDASFAALATTMTNAGGPIDPTNFSQIQQLISTVMSATGASLDQTMLDGVTEIVVASNLAVQNAVQNLTGLAALSAINALERVAQGAASDALAGVGTDHSKMLQTIGAFSDHLDFAVTAAQSQAGDLDGPSVQNPPQALDDQYSIGEHQTLTVSDLGVLANDIDPDGAPLTAILVSTPSHGGLTLNLDGSFSYTPNANFIGADVMSGGWLGGHLADG